MQPVRSKEQANRAEADYGPGYGAATKISAFAAWRKIWSTGVALITFLLCVCPLGVASTCPTEVRATSEAEYLAGVNCSRTNRNQRFIINLPVDIELVTPWPQYAYLYVEDNMNVVIKGTKAGGELTRFEGTSNRLIYMVGGNSRLVLENLDIRGGNTPWVSFCWLER